MTRTAQVIGGKANKLGRCEFTDGRGVCRRSATHEITGWFNHKVCWPHAVVVQQASRWPVEIRELERKG